MSCKYMFFLCIFLQTCSFFACYLPKNCNVCLSDVVNIRANVTLLSTKNYKSFFICLFTALYQPKSVKNRQLQGPMSGPNR